MHSVIVDSNLRHSTLLGMNTEMPQNENLPPVEPPSAGFLVQLFLVPAIIVSIIVCVWLAFHWLAHLGNDPQSYVRTLRRSNEGRWQAALNLANELRGPRGTSLKNDESLALELGNILSEEVESGRSGEQSQTLRLYLCRALGEFVIPSAASPLVTQAQRISDPETARAAVEALAVLDANLKKTDEEIDVHADIVSAVIESSLSENDALRGACAFTLGVVGGETAEERLIQLNTDDNDDVRFNAALGLARLGRDESLDTLADMLSQKNTSSSRQPDNPVAQSEKYKRALVVINALRGLAMLVDSVQSPLPREIIEQIRALQTDDVNEVRASAVALLKKIERIEKAA